MSEVRATAPRVTVLPATRNRFTTAPIASVQKRRVAAYARVSTDSDEQLTSYEAQVDYYTHYIKERPDWSFAGMYADEGISGTNTRRREGFNQMIADALAGKIDLIVTKSVSRFARNTVDIDILFLKKDLDATLFQCANGRQGVHSISGKAGNGFCNDEVDFPGQRIFDGLRHRPRKGRAARARGAGGRSGRPLYHHGEWAGAIPVL